MRLYHIYKLHGICTRASLRLELININDWIVYLFSSVYYHQLNMIFISAVMRVYITNNHPASHIRSTCSVYY